MAALANGDLDARLPTGPGKDIGRLATAFNAMAAALQQRLSSVREREQKFQAIANFAHAAEFWFAPNGKLVWVNSSIERLTGYTVEECYARKDFPLFCIHPEDCERVLMQSKDALLNQTSGDNFEFRVLRKDGAVFWAANNWRPIYGENGEYLGLRASIESIQSRKQAQAALQETFDVLFKTQHEQHALLEQMQAEHARLVALLSAMEIGVLFIDGDGRIVYGNPGVARIWDLPAVEPLLNRPASDLLSSGRRLPRDSEVRRELARELAKPAIAAARREITLGDGRTILVHVFPVHDPQEEPLGHLWLFEDVTHERLTAEKLVYLAERDALTGLFNRHRFHIELEHLLLNADRAQQPLALLYFDLDEFKHINDSFGHHAGDAALVRLAGEISLQLRRNAVFCRVGGDEFAVLAPECDAEEAGKLAGRIIRVIAQTYFALGEQQLRLTCSVGIALYPDHAGNAAELVTRADVAMYQAKDAGKNTWRIYRRERDESHSRVRTLAWSDRLGKALENDLFDLRFQGVYRARDRQLSHLEALVYLLEDGANGQAVPPAQFIAAAENTGIILELDRWVIDNAIALLAAHPDLPGLAVNLSGRSLDDPAMPEWIAARLTSHRVLPNRLLIEITETSAVQDLKDAQRFVDALRELGCRICLDDFGSGFASFIYLKHLATDIIKIDGEFIRNLINDRDDQLFVRAIIDVARGMGKLTVAEFVEDEQTAALLQTYGIDLLQGYYFDRPVSAHPALSTGVLPIA
jgi:diguanylate cyclase (GGDEF)-like protein/PAS domain S-box-containing protein